MRFRIDQDGLNGVFHPKLYLFSNSETEWEAVVGSANFTAGAFGRNIEHAVVIGSGDENAGVMSEPMPPRYSIPALRNE